ncbi:SGNH/GDSL hydrolase family protein [Simiduia agarivorans]|uniref:G-D-S-L family lipolytic protein n=1 Tax=Simiduia agarivorans (strain DSM 21679 / JCM 13881 / BCRC 17597 / SA1) TaxID=1117647 RepID=K4KL49_SIMAS|nr:GDSL-type esterase/lipase family protein [Simiduia agarivorans]AFU98955.1 G-D-S-L family lipolytic protein [Simiduia agarivorans SA1 = DSM 21679]
MQWWLGKSSWIKLLGIASLLGLLAFATTWYVCVGRPDAYANYRKVLADHHKRLARSITSSSHVFLGASTMQGLDVSQVALNSINLSIGSETLAALSHRLHQYPKIHHAAAVYILAGYNDLCDAGETQTLRALAATLEFIGKSPDINVIGLQLELFASGCNGINNRITGYNQAAGQLCGSVSNCRFIDPNPFLKGADGLPAAEYYEADGLHLNEQGYRALVRGLKAVLPAH